LYKISFEPLFIGLLYLEFIFKILSNISINLESIFLIVLNCLFISTLFYFLGSFFNDKTRKVLYYIFLFIFTIYFCSQFLINNLFGFYYDLGILDQAKQVTAFWYDALVLIYSNLLNIIIFLVPFIVSLLLIKKLYFVDLTIKTKILMFVVCLLTISTDIAYMIINENKTNSPYSLAFKSYNTNLSINKLGVLTSFETDAYKRITGFKEELVIIDDEPIEEEPIKEYTYHQLDINFDNLISSETNDNVIALHEYFKNINGTLENEYTSMFENKNVVVIIAESFSSLSVKEDLTPTLYKLINEGFTFNNYYSTSMYSTVGGEFQFNTGLYPLSGCTDIWKAGTNTWSQGIANMFKKNGYSTYAYHDNTYNYLDRDKYIASLGFDNYEGCGNGIECKMDCRGWTESDLEMIDSTYKDYINDDKFMVYYTTVSGHGLYTFDASVNSMGRKYKDFIYDCGYTYSEPVTAYLSSMVELDKALESLINHLNEYDKLDDTLIVLLPDHYPYYLEEDQLNELAGGYIEQYIDVSKNNLIIYNSTMENVQVDKVGSTIDVLPTLYNLMGFDYDSRFFVGNDILSNVAGLAMFGNNSWVSDKGKYYTSLDKFISTNDEEISDEYIDKICKIVNNRTNLSLKIVQNDYYSIVMPN